MGPNPIWLVSLEEEEIWTQKETPGITAWGYSEKAAIC